MIGNLLVSAGGDTGSVRGSAKGHASRGAEDGAGKFDDLLTRRGLGETKTPVSAAARIIQEFEAANSDTPVVEGGFPARDEINAQSTDVPTATVEQPVQPGAEDSGKAPEPEDDLGERLSAVAELLAALASQSGGRSKTAEDSTGNTVSQERRGKVDPPGHAASDQPLPLQGNEMQTVRGRELAMDHVADLSAPEVAGRGSDTVAQVGNRAADFESRRKANGIENAVNRISATFTRSETSLSGLAGQKPEGGLPEGRQGRNGDDNALLHRAVAERAPARMEDRAPVVARDVDTAAPFAKVSNAVAPGIPAGDDVANVGRQVSEAVTRELGDMNITRIVASEQAVGGKSVKVLRLQLNPAELGTVHIRLQSVDGELRVAIRAESDQAAQMIARDGDAIRSALRAVGVASADVTVTAGRGEQAQHQFQDNQQRGQGGYQNGADQNSGGMGDGSSQAHDRRPFGQRTADLPTHEHAGADNADSGGGIFI
jgi:flagellar hook-length control protein FliK